MLVLPEEHRDSNQRTIGSLDLDLDGKNGKEEHLDRGTRGVPEGTWREAKVIRLAGVHQISVPKQWTYQKHRTCKRQ